MELLSRLGLIPGRIYRVVRCRLSSACKLGEDSATTLNMPRRNKGTPDTTLTCNPPRNRARTKSTAGTRSLVRRRNLNRSLDDRNVGFKAASHRKGRARPKTGDAWSPAMERGCDQDGLTCWRHRHTGVVQYVNPARVLPPLAPHPHMVPRFYFFPDVEPDRITAGMWQEYTDEKTKKPFWYNIYTRKTQWENPFQAAWRPPPPPPPPPPKCDIPEHLQWTRKQGPYWVNSVTGKSQTTVPDCCRKYK